MTAVACTDEFRTIPGHGEWVVYIRRVSVGNLAELKQYFEQPTVATASETSGCTEDDDDIRVPVFVDAQGSTLVPLIPADACDESSEDADDAIGGKHLRWHVVWVRRLRKIPSASSK